MRNFTKYILRKVYLDSLVRELLQKWRAISWHFSRGFGQVDRKIIDRYFADQKERKLHIGCGGNILKGWINSDLNPRSDSVLYLNAAGTFPFKNDEFDYVFSEHVISSLSYSDASVMLRECRRILRDKGKIRVSTPDLLFLIKLYNNDNSETQKEYIKWATDKYAKGAPYYDSIFVINNFLCKWGFFVYDEKTLRFSLERAGFKNIIRRELKESSDGALRNLENEKRMPNGFLALESLILEGTKTINCSQETHIM